MQGRDLTQFVNDFTWYMRNLMLIKASDDMEDILDVSTENLQQLKEEAGMVRSDTLMRFIRIFSELANQIRYASNKRVLLELALIKLCKPEAERDELSLLERIRKLERTMEQVSSGVMPFVNGKGQQERYGQNVQMAGGSGYVENAQMMGGSGYVENAQTMDGSGYGEKAQMAAPYPKAAPEDLKKVRSMWKSIVGETTGMFRVVLSAAEPKFNAQNEKDGKLYVVFADFLAERYLDNKEKKAELEQIIEERTGKHVEIKFVLAADEGIQRGKLSSIEIEERIHEFIHTDIEIED